MAQNVISKLKTLWSLHVDALNDNFDQIWTKLFATGKVLSDFNYDQTAKDALTKSIPRTGLTYEGQFDLSQAYQNSYLQYITNVAETPTVAASPLTGAFIRVVFNAGASASLVATNLGTKRVGSDNFTANKLNEIIVVQEEEGLYYSIKVLN